MDIFGEKLIMCGNRFVFSEWLHIWANFRNCCKYKVSQLQKQDNVICYLHFCWLQTCVISIPSNIHSRCHKAIVLSHKGSFTLLSKSSCKHCDWWKKTWRGCSCTEWVIWLSLIWLNWNAIPFKSVLCLLKCLSKLMWFCDSFMPSLADSTRND